MIVTEKIKKYAIFNNKTQKFVNISHERDGARNEEWYQIGEVDHFENALLYYSADRATQLLTNLGYTLDYYAIKEVIVTTKKTLLA